MLSFVDRGDPATWDWTLANFTADDDWHTLDCSSIVPEGAIAILIRASIAADTAGRYFGFRKHGNVNAYNTAGLRTQVANIYIDNYVLVFCDSDRKLDYMGTSDGWSAISVVIGGWFILT